MLGYKASIKVKKKNSEKKTHYNYNNLLKYTKDKMMQIWHQKHKMWWEETVKI